MTIADEMTDVSGLKTLITKFRFFEGWDLREMVVTIAESTETSEVMKKRATEALQGEFEEHTNLNNEEFETLFRKKTRAVGQIELEKCLNMQD